MSTHVIHFTGPINSTSCGQLIAQCSQAIQQDASRILLKIATMGGDCSYGFTMYNFLLSLPVPVHTHNLGTVESMGNILFLAGEQRTASRHSKFLYHSFYWNLNNSVDHARMAEYAMCLDYDLDLYARIVAERTANAAEALDIHSCLKANARLLSPEAALTTGVIHAVDECRVQPGEVTTFIHL